MKKLFILLAAAGIFATSQVNAADLVDYAKTAQEKIDSAPAGIENKKEEIAARKAEKEAAAKARKAEKKAAIEAKKAEKKAAAEAQKAEREKALEDTKNSLDNLKKAWTK